MNEAKYRIVSIGEVARLTGATIKQIRYWTDQGLMECPEKVKSGKRDFRYFNETDLEIIRSIKDLLDQGYTLRAAAQRAAEKFDTGGNQDEEKE